MEIAAPKPEPAPGLPTSYAARFAHGAFWSFVGIAGARLATFLGAVVAARFLGQVGFGELAMIQSTIGLLGTFAGLGIGMTAMKYVAELKGKDPKRSGRIIALTYLVSWTTGGLMALVCIAAAPWLAARTLNAPHLVPELRLASLLLLVSAGFGPQGGILAGCQAFRAIARINWWQGLLSLPLTIVLVWLAGLRGVILALFFSTLLGGVLSSLALGKEYRNLHLKLDFLGAWKEKAILWQFSLPSFLANTLYTPVIWAANAILVNRPNGYAELGLFNAAMQFNWLITALNSISAPVIVPLLAEIHGGDEPERFGKAFSLNLRLNWGIALAMGFLVLGFSPWILNIFGNKFQNGGEVLTLTVCFTVVNVACGISGQSFLSSGRAWIALAITSVWAGLLLSAAYFLIPIFEAKGLALSFLVAYSLALILQLYVIKYLFGKVTVSGSYPLLLSCGTLIIMALFAKYIFLVHYLHCCILISLSLASIYFIYRKDHTLLQVMLSQYKSVIQGRF